MADWNYQVAIVTGSSRGIGRAIGRALAARGAAICINYAGRTAEAEAAAGEIAATGGRVIAIQADVADADAVARMVARTEAELGPVSILVNNAGVSSPATLESYDPAAMARMRRVNVDGVIPGAGPQYERTDDDRADRAARRYCQRGGLLRSAGVGLCDGTGAHGRWWADGLYRA